MDRREFRDLLERLDAAWQRQDTYEDVHMPRNTGAGVILSALALVLGFAMVWYMWWLAGAALAGLLVVSILHTFNYDREYFITPEEVARSERAAGA